ncbi:MAG: NUDIX hydrolase [Holophagaceae bacterium]|uniref:NUDIX hydrolase n=1 Tax=Candidatus Geothrix odensensis TaxID=2954440 RepID=A0A936F375_9BACT|nr:NUDIX hydrolase [Candidatus Geothrix odensensis]
MPHEMNGVHVRPWRRPPKSRREWNLLADEMFFAERLFHPPDGKIPAAGAVVVEPDGRVWLVSPTNQHGGGQQTFPKGTVSGLSLASTALKEVLDKTGLQIELMDHPSMSRGTLPSPATTAPAGSGAPLRPWDGGARRCTWCRWSWSRSASICRSTIRSSTS